MGNYYTSCCNIDPVANGIYQHSEENSKALSHDEASRHNAAALSHIREQSLMSMEFEIKEADKQL